LEGHLGDDICNRRTVVDAGVRGAIYHTALDGSQAVSVALTAPLVNLQIFSVSLLSPTPLALRRSLD